LDGVIAEDGRVRELKVVDGDPMLADAAMQAVSKWRYHPYKLNGAPIRMGTKITLIFDLSQPPQSRDESAPIPPPGAEVSGGSDKAVAGLRSSSAVFPQPVTVSQGLSGGTLEYKIDPIYPKEARLLRREGRVTLDAVIAEDGRLRALKVVDGDPMLAGAAIQAVSKWRYHPYKLNGAPIRMGTKITLIFKLP
jgi:TonB family protein